MIYLVGDLQGCCDALDRLLAKIDFSPSRDRLYVLGDLVNRGPCSLQVLQRLIGMGDAATCLLGNHDLHLMAVAQGVRPQHRSDTLSPILESPDCDALIDWVRTRRLAVHAEGWLMVHAGVAPQWDLALTLQLAAEVEAELASPQWSEFLQVMYGNEPSRWKPRLDGADRWRFAINVLTRVRYVDARGTLDFKVEGSRRQGAEGALSVVRGPRPPHAGSTDRVRPLVDTRPRESARPAGHRHRLRLGRRAHCSSHRRRTAGNDPGRLRNGAAAWLISAAATGSERRLRT